MVTAEYTSAAIRRLCNSFSVAPNDSVSPNQFCNHQSNVFCHTLLSRQSHPTQHRPFRPIQPLFAILHRTHSSGNAGKIRTTPPPGHGLKCPANLVYNTPDAPFSQSATWDVTESSKKPNGVLYPYHRSPQPRVLVRRSGRCCAAVLCIVDLSQSVTQLCRLSEQMFSSFSVVFDVKYYPQTLAKLAHGIHITRCCGFLQPEKEIIFVLVFRA